MGMINGIDSSLTDEIVKIILSHKQVEKIAIFGSRANSDFKKISDIDIAIFGREWSDKDINIAKNMLEEKVKTPLKFDVLNFYSIEKKKLKENILRSAKVIYETR